MHILCDSSGWRSLNDPRFGDTYIKHDDGTLDVVRDGAKEPHSYAPGAWANVQGDEKSFKRSGFRSWLKR